MFFILKRIAAAIPTLLGVTIVLFIALRLLPGDPVSVILGSAPATPEVEAALRAQFGLDKPMWQQYVDYLGNALTLDFGTSYSTREQVTSMIAGQVWPTLQLALAAALISAITGLFFGAFAAMNKGRWPDAVIRVLSLLNTSMPSFWVGLLLIMVFSFQLNWFPAAGSGDLSTLVLPALALGLSAGGTVARLVRNSVIDVLGENFVAALHAKGLSRQLIVYKHVLRNAVIPTVTVVGLQLGALVAGAVIVEAVFARQGLGQMLVQGIGSNDFPVIQGVVLVIAVIYILINIVVDISYAYIDPRIRRSLNK
ncbi:ABC transporter permease [Propionibacteriaceae bacterium G1746]|uniref:ABC transporter permease n=1 Tax=Aestuariimicrobium sp. G57 TaxID=3418485 RepID=UPI003C1472FC